MKKITFLLPVLFSLKAFSQQPYYDFKNFMEHSPIYKVPDYKPHIQDSLQKLLDIESGKTSINNLGTLEFTQTNGTKVYSLPNDHMPCLVPDLSRTNYNMPNPMKGERITGMPPGSIPRYKVVPKK